MLDWPHIGNARGSSPVVARQQLRRHPRAFRAGRGNLKIEGNAVRRIPRGPPTFQASQPTRPLGPSVKQVTGSSPFQGLEPTNPAELAGVAETGEQTE